MRGSISIRSDFNIDAAVVTQAIWPGMSEIPSGWIGFLGRLHPSLVHLPIGFITFLAVIEVAACWPRFKEAAAAKRLLLLLSIISVMVAAGCGWILSFSGGYAAEMLTWHKWLGTTLFPLVVLLWVLRGHNSVRAYRVCLGLTVGLVVFTGHFGGILVRGENYLIPKPRKALAQPSDASPDTPVTRGNSDPTAFALLIQPVFNEYCIACHGAEKSKAKLRLDTAGDLFKGSESGPVVRPGLPEQSPLLRRLHLPLDDDDHMPPKGKKQPSPREIALLEWWINVGAPVDKTVNQLKLPEVK